MNCLEQACEGSSASFHSTHYTETGFGVWDLGFGGIGNGDSSRRRWQKRERRFEGGVQQLRRISRTIARAWRSRQARELLAPGGMSRIVSYRDLIALGEHAELETQMLVAERRGYARAADIADFNTLSAQVGQLAHALLRSLEALE